MSAKFAYQIYLRSYFDSNNDGIGDIGGVTQKIDYLSNLGVDVIWLSPFYTTPDYDNGYDVADYKNIDNKFGTLEDFKQLVHVAKANNIELMLDIVPNHTSSEHDWFKQAVADPESAYRDYYIFRDLKDGELPNNWLSVFGGPAWSPSPNENDKQVYCHLFLKEQPDLDWANPQVYLEFDSIFNFWIDKGAKYFRIDVSQGMKKDLYLSDNKQITEINDSMGPIELFHAYEHINDWHRKETLEIFRWWRKQLSRKGASVYGEYDSDDVDEIDTLLDDGNSLNGFFMLSQSHCSWDPEKLFNYISSYSKKTKDSAVWYFSSHDASRIATRFGGGQTGKLRSLSLFAFTALLDGLHFLYNGEELGLEDATITGEFRDPVALRNDTGASESRDPCRSVMPWDDSINNGFSNHIPWLESQKRTNAETVASQEVDESSFLNSYRKIIAYAKSNEHIYDFPVEMNDIYSYQRGDIQVIFNPTQEPIKLNNGEIMFRSYPSDEYVIHPEETVCLKF